MSYSCLWCIDHDGTASLGDIGRDYLYEYLPGIDSPDDFVKEVMKIRNDLDYKDKILRGKEPYEEGLELALLLAYHNVKRNDVIDSGQNAKNSLRLGFPEFLNKESDDIKIIFSAGPQDWLMNFYMHNFPNKKFDVVGTKLGINENFEYCGIEDSCGRESKPKRIEKKARRMNGMKYIGVGDSRGDEKMFEYIKGKNGITVAIGSGVKGDINLSEDTDWYSVVSEVKKYSGAVHVR